MEEKAVFDIIVTPKSSRSSISLEEGDLIRVKLNSPPVEGRANAECVKLFSKVLAVPKSAIEIIKGEKGRRKRIAIEGLSRDEALERIRNLQSDR
jgi:uncharacterized protein (TIGR00251 family)